MGGGDKTQRKAKNDKDEQHLTTNEKILKDVHDAFYDEDLGLKAFADSLGITCFPPRKKTTVMLVGNHSAGKSSFINWYVEQSVLKTGVAIETAGFVVVTSGKRRETLTGEATIHLYPHFSQIGSEPNFMKYIQTEVSTSKEKSFPLVTFIDSPGLVDGNFEYPYDVEKSITEFAPFCDLIFVFLDPIGKALSARTMSLVEKLNQGHAEKIKYFMGKADELPNDLDRQKVLIQTTQVLSSRIQNKHSFDLPTIYIPREDRKCHVPNAIFEACDDIKNSINLNIQHNIRALEKYAMDVHNKIEHDIKMDDALWKQNLANSMWSFVFFVLAFVPMGLVVVRSMWDTTWLTPVREYFPDDAPSYLEAVTIEVWGGTLFVCLLTAFIFFRMNKSGLGGYRRNEMLEMRLHIKNKIIPLKKDLYDLYFSQTLEEDHMN